MKTSMFQGKLFPLLSAFIKNRIEILIIIISCFQFSELKSQNCATCCVPSFPSLTVYQAFQTGHGMGFGVEAGTWNKDASKFSYFIGTSMVWAGSTNTLVKESPSETQVLLSFYVKGQYRLTNHLYVVMAPGIVNLSYFELQTGLRYVVPLTRVIGIGFEPAYALNQRQFVMNANIHFALR
jgi:hypothetical protein